MMMSAKAAKGKTSQIRLRCSRSKKSWSRTSRRESRSKEPSASWRFRISWMTQRSKRVRSKCRWDRPLVDPRHPLIRRTLWINPRSIPLWFVRNSERFKSFSNQSTKMMKRKRLWIETFNFARKSRTRFLSQFPRELRNKRKESIYRLLFSLIWFDLKMRSSFIVSSYKRNLIRFCSMRLDDWGMEIIKRLLLIYQLIRGKLNRVWLMSLLM